MPQHLPFFIHRVPILYYFAVACMAEAFEAANAVAISKAAYPIETTESVKRVNSADEAGATRSQNLIDATVGIGSESRPKSCEKSIFPSGFLALQNGFSGVQKRLSRCPKRLFFSKDAEART
jgi:hypothetical protein